MPTVIFGLEAKIYINTGTYDSPVWSEYKNAKDVTLTLEKDEGDATTRASNGWEQVKGKMKKAMVEFDALWKTSDSLFASILTAFLNSTELEFLVLDGDVNTTGSQGLRASMQVMNCTRQENLKDPVTAKVQLKPGPDTDNPPAWYTVA